MSDPTFNKVRLAVKTLMNGLPIEIGEDKYFMSEDFELCVESTRYTLSGGKRINEKIVYLPVDMSLGQFIKWCNLLTSEDTIILAGNLTLNNID